MFCSSFGNQMVMEEGVIFENFVHLRIKKIVLIYKSQTIIVQSGQEGTIYTSKKHVCTQRDHQLTLVEFFFYNCVHFQRERLNFYNSKPDQHDQLKLYIHKNKMCLLPSIIIAIALKKKDLKKEIFQKKVNSLSVPTSISLTLIQQKF